jgi:hypothetical protein
LSSTIADVGCFAKRKQNAWQFPENPSRRHRVTVKTPQFRGDTGCSAKLGGRYSTGTIFRKPPTAALGVAMQGVIPGYPFYYPPVAAGKKYNLGTIFDISVGYFGTITELFNNQVGYLPAKAQLASLFKRRVVQKFQFLNNSYEKTVDKGDDIL